jgi:DNA repair protein RecO
MDKDLELVYSIFKIRLLALLGFVPKIDACSICDKKMTEDMDKFYFSIKDDGIKCADCAKLDKGIVHLNKTSFLALIYILSCDAKKLYSFEVPKDSIAEISLLSRLYTNQKLEKEYEVNKI